MSEPPIVLGSRKSDLALWQALEVLRVCAQGAPRPRALEVRTEAASGDVAQDAALSTLAAGNPGLFTKELEVGLISRAYDLAVHSLKDMPTSLPAGLRLAGVTARDDPRDAVVLPARHAGAGARGLEDLPPGAVVGTSSLRREAYLRRCFPHLRAALVRGNLNTRLRKLDEGAPAAPPGGSDGAGGAPYDALMLASAGLLRMGWGDRVSSAPSAADCPYGVGQGALGLEAREGDEAALALAREVTHPATALCCLAERAFLRALQGGCQVPIGVATTLEGGGEACGEGGAAGAGESGDGAVARGGGGGGVGAPPPPPPLSARTLTLTGTVTSLDGAQVISVVVREAVMVPRGAALRRVNAWGLDGVAAVKAAAAARGEGAALRLEAGAEGAGGGRPAWVGVTAAEWAALEDEGARVGQEAARRLARVRGAQELLERLGVGRGPARPITYGALEAPVDRP
jgi:hydroxymethylbilane synthase